MVLEQTFDDRNSLDFGDSIHEERFEEENEMNSAIKKKKLLKYRLGDVRNLAS